MKLLGEGMTAKIYEHTPKSIAKVFHADLPWKYAEYERDLLAIVSDLDIQTAKYLDFQTIDRQPAIIMERIDGTSLFSEVLRKPWNALALLRSFVEAQKNIHAKTTNGLPREKTRFKAQLLRSGLDSGALDKISCLIDKLPECNSVCHGDFHFGNVISSYNGLYTIDWMNSYSGNPLGDIFRSYLMLKSPYNPLPIQGMRKLVFMSFKSVLGSLYLRRALRGLELSKNQRMMWLAIVAAVRLCDQVPHEREWLVRFLEKAPDSQASMA